MNNIFVWKNGEHLAEKYLKDLGYKIIDRNAKNKIAEVDIIALDGEDLVFIEVKARTGKKYGLPLDAINKAKQRKYILFSQSYIVAKRLADKNIRFDVIEVLNDDINHIVNAFDAY